ncbi:AAA family ATPase [uncultured Haemophilus sp.]|uniref:AAA family ATPase n=1 Tax=uncultured Haemophilus sp. TaxID=237779 RepID=UPI00258F15A3|nr:AAA family ATPase [uncultured Haemophilus sp.]
MKISKVKIKDFKRFKDLTLDLGNTPAKIIALVGTNGCGKSSVLDAFIACGKNYGGRIRDFNTPEIFYRTDNKNAYQLISIEYIDNNGNIFDNNGLYANHNFYKNNKEVVFSFRSPYRYNTELNITVTKATEPIEKNSDGASCSLDLDSKIENNYRRLLGFYSRVRDKEDIKPSEARSKVLSMLNESIKRCLDLEINDLGSVEDNNGTLMFKKSDSELCFSFNSLSAGEKEVVDILLDLFLRKEKYKNSIFLLDEPELHINTAVQRKLIIEIDKLIGDGGQIWIATHSIGFLRAFQEELSGKCQVIHFENNMRFASETITLTPVANNRTTWKSIFGTALDDLTGLIAPNRIIYCEGRDEPRQDGSERGLDAQVLNNIFNTEYPDTVFVSSGGNTELDQRSSIALAILGKVFPDMEIWVFKDRDMASGKLVSESDRKEYLNNQDKRFRVMKRWEIENYLFDKEVLRKYCMENQKAFDEIKYDANFTSKDLIDSDVKSQFSLIKSICSIPTHINSENFKINLSKLVTPDMNIYQELESCIFDRK